MENLTDIAVFCRVVDTGSFTKAAEQLVLSRAVVSKYITRLEARLGARLLHRTTRRLSLTEAGEKLYESSHGALLQIEEAELEIGQLQREPRGLLKVSAPMSFGIQHIAPALSAFLGRHPRVLVDMRMDDRLVDVVEEGFDLAIRIAALNNSTLIARKLAPCRFVVCAAKTYLDQHGVPLTLEDLHDHNCIIYTYTARPNVWHFTAPDGKEIAAPVRGNLRVNNGMVNREVGLKGLGIIKMPTFQVGDLIREGQLKVVLPDYKGQEVSVYAVYPERKYLSPKVRAFIEFLAERFSPEPYWDDF
jgi:DNA-binding transcriptional LysR family regulator